VEVEVETLDEFKAALAAGADVIMLDDMTDGEVEEALRLRGERAALLEVSGGVTLERLHGGTLPPVDRVSAGALTHSARPVDLALYVRGVSEEEGDTGRGAQGAGR